MKGSGPAAGPSSHSQAGQQHTRSQSLSALLQAPVQEEDESHNISDSDYTDHTDLTTTLTTLSQARERPGRQSADSRELTSAILSVYLDADSRSELHGGQDCLYVAEATTAYDSRGTYRKGYPILTFDEGAKMFVEQEEADTSAGGAGWLLCTNGEGQRGYIRTEMFCLAD